MIFYTIEFILELIILLLIWKFWLNKKPKKNKKLLIILLLGIFLIIPLKANALTLSDGATVPDVPNEFDNYIIHYYINNNQKQYFLSNILEGGNCWIKNNGNVATSKTNRYIISNNQWTLNMYINGNSEYDGETLLASSKDRYNLDGTELRQVAFGLENSIPEPEYPEGIINKIALIFKDIYEDLEENDIKFYQILIGLLVFNFILYELCYITRAFRRKI